jgi:hypothetical protein
MGGFSESDLVMLTNTLDQDLSVYVGLNVKLVVYPLNNAVAPATQLTCLQLPTPDALTRSGDSRGHIERSISRILCIQAYVDLLAFCKPPPLDYMRVISGTGRGALAIFFALYKSSFKVSSNSYTMAAHRVFGLTAEHTFHVRKCPRCNEYPYESRGSGSSSTVSGTFMSGERSVAAMLIDHIRKCPSARAHGSSFSSTIGLSTCLKSSCLKRGLLRGGTCGWRSAVFGWELLEIVLGMWFG